MKKANMIRIIEKGDLNQSVLVDDEECDDTIVYEGVSTYKKMATKFSKNVSIYTGNESIVSLDANNISSLFMKRYHKFNETSKSILLRSGKYELINNLLLRH